MKCFADGFISHFEYDPPEPWGHVDNYKPLAGAEGEAALRKAMRKEVMAGRMIGGPGWTSQKIRQFFSGKEFYGVPCSATTKDGDPRGRIIHDYVFSSGAHIRLTQHILRRQLNTLRKWSGCRFWNM